MIIKCPRCKAIIKEEDNYCRDCGLEIKQPDEQVPVVRVLDLTKENKEDPKMTETNNELLEEAYIGRNYKQLNSGIFSFVAMCLGPVCFLYRKMYRSGIIMAAIIHLSTVILQPYSFFVAMPIHLFCGVTYKLMYTAKVKKEVERIREENPEAKERKLLKICQREGGYNTWVVLLDILVGIIFFSIAMEM